MILCMANNDPLNKSEIEVSKRLNRIWHAKKKQLGLSQERAAEIYGCSQGNISQYLNGKIPLNTDAIYKFAKMLCVSPSEIKPELKEAASMLLADTGELTAKSLLPILERLSPIEAAKFLGMAEAIVDEKLKGSKAE
jgi:transcriptional regulator with XRE-family HTH domain